MFTRSTITYCWPRFNLPKEAVETFLAQVEQEGFLVSAKPLKFSLPDPGDEPFLEVALSARVAAIVTGSKRHFPNFQNHLDFLTPFS